MVQTGAIVRAPCHELTGVLAFWKPLFFQATGVFLRERHTIEDGLFKEKKQVLQVGWTWCLRLPLNLRMDLAPKWVVPPTILQADKRVLEDDFACGEATYPLP